MPDTTNPDDVSRRLGIPIDTTRARPDNDITAPSVLPASGPMRPTPSPQNYGTSDSKGNGKGKVV
jgi:hypothetical protein